MEKKIILLIVTLTISTTLFSQSIRKFIDTGSVKNQFDYLINKSNRYQNYKVVEINWLLKLKRNVVDSLATSKKEIVQNYTLINNQKNTISDLNESLTNSKNTITTLNSEKKSISFLGASFSKSFFKTIVFLIIGLLIAFLSLFVFKFKQSNSITVQTKLTLNELEEAFDAHRKRALEREQKVMRKLQDELNKQKDS